jgi:hypothetical protein
MQVQHITVKTGAVRRLPEPDGRLIEQHLELTATLSPDDDLDAAVRSLQERADRLLAAYEAGRDDPMGEAIREQRAREHLRRAAVRKRER